jgi:uncharacterized protein YkwD
MAAGCLAMASLLWALFSECCCQESATKLDRDEAKKAFEFLNAVRRDPPSFSKDIGADLKEARATTALKWNATLAKVAEEKALDMAKRDYFSHENSEGLGINFLIHKAGYKLPDYMLKDKKANSFESIAVGITSGKDVVRTLIVDKGVDSRAHRKHLLGMDDFHSKHKDAGIGFVRNPKGKYKIYICIIIAHQP